MAEGRQVSDFFRGFIEETTKIARKEEGAKTEEGRFLATKILGLLGAGAGVVPGGLHHIREVERGRELWGRKSKYPRWLVGNVLADIQKKLKAAGIDEPARAIRSARDAGLDKTPYRTLRHVSTRFDVPSLIRRSLGGAAIGLTAGALSGALIDYLRRKRKE